MPKVTDLNKYMEERRSDTRVMVVEAEPHWELHQALQGLRVAIQMIDGEAEGYNKPRYQAQGTHAMNVSYIEEMIFYLKRYMVETGALEAEEEEDA